MPTANQLYQQAKVAGNVSFQAEWGRTQQQLAKLSAGERVSQLGFSSLEPGEYVMAYDALGQARMRIGHQSDGTVGVIYGNGTPPPIPTAPSVGARQLGVFIGWDGTFAAGYAKPGDFARIDVHMSEEQGFLPNGETIVGTIPQEGGILVGADSVTHYIKLVAVSSSDVASAPTTEVAVLPLPAGQIAAGAIGAQQFAADIAMLSRLIVGDPAAARLEVDGRVGATVPGMHLYNGAGAETFTLDALTGNVSMLGSLRTAATGERIVIREAGANDIRFYPPTGANYATLSYYGGTVGGGTGDASFAGIGLGSSTLSTGWSGFSFVSPYAFLAGVQSTAPDKNGGQITAQDNGLFLDGPWTGGSARVSRMQLSATQGLLYRGLFSNPILTSIAWSDSSVDIKAPSVTIEAGTQVRFSNIGTNALMTAVTSGTAIYFTPTGIDVYAPTQGAAYREVRASNITSGSARSLKSAVEDLPFDPERAVVDAPSQMWEYRVEQEDEKGRKRKARKRVGPMADDLPSVLRRPMGPNGDQVGVDINGMLGVLWGATGQQTARLDALESRLATLETA